MSIFQLLILKSYALVLILQSDVNFAVLLATFKIHIDWLSLSSRLQPFFFFDQYRACAEELKFHQEVYELQMEYNRAVFDALK